MDFKAAAVVLLGAVVMTQAAPGVLIFHRDYLNLPVATGNVFASRLGLGAGTGVGMGLSSTSPQSGDSSSSPGSLTAAAESPNNLGSPAKDNSGGIGTLAYAAGSLNGIGLPGSDKSGSLGSLGTATGGLNTIGSSLTGNNNFFNPSFFPFYNEDFEFDNEEFGLFRGSGGFFDFDPEEAFFPYF